MYSANPANNVLQGILKVKDNGVYFTLQFDRTIYLMDAQKNTQYCICSLFFFFQI